MMNRVGRRGAWAAVCGCVGCVIGLAGVASASTDAPVERAAAKATEAPMQLAAAKTTEAHVQLVTAKATETPVQLAAANATEPADAGEASSASGKPDSASDETPDVAPAAAKPTAAAGALLWSPRTDRGAPALREGGATRGIKSGLAVMTLVPPIDAAALSLGAQPVLHWYLSADSPYPVEFTLVDPDEIDPVVEVTLGEAGGAGIHSVDLAEHGVELEAGRAYQWYVALVPDRAKRSSDVLARAMVTRVDEPELAARVAQAGSNAEAVRMLAAEGIWYEALEQARRDAVEAPDDAAAQARLAMLLDQVGIDLPAN